MNDYDEIERQTGVAMDALRVYAEAVRDLCGMVDAYEAGLMMERLVTDADFALLVLPGIADKAIEEGC